MKIVSTLFSFGGGRAITARHVRLWREVSDELLVVSPEDSPCVVHGPLLWTYEVSNKFGMPCLRRQLAGMSRALGLPGDIYVFCEYDGFLTRRPEARIGLQANAFEDLSGRYASRRFFHFPWIFDRASLETFLGQATFEPFEEGFVDRWLAAQMDRLATIPVFDLQASGEGFSRNTIEGDGESALLKAVESGAYAIHGVKSASLFRRVLAASGWQHLDLPNEPAESTRTRSLFGKHRPRRS